MELPVGTRFWRTSTFGTQEYRIIKDNGESWTCDFYLRGRLHSRGTYHPYNFKLENYTIEYPKSREFTTLYDKLNETV